MTLPTGFSFSVTVSGNPSNPTGVFVQNNFNACIVTSTGPLTCDGMFNGLPAFKDEPATDPQCAPANCLINNQCNMVPPSIAFTYQVTTPGGTPQLTTVSLPGTPLTTCTSQGLSNPITFVWAPG